jgi:hypothetical protein
VQAEHNAKKYLSIVEAHTLFHPKAKVQHLRKTGAIKRGLKLRRYQICLKVGVF